MEPRRMGRTGHLIIYIVMTCTTVAYATDWSSLDHYQRTISRAEFENLLTHVFCPSGALTNYLNFGTNSVTVFSTPEKTSALFTLQLASATSSNIQHSASFKRIALDPGHIGGEWARI